jgi:hypothetical protein
MPVGATPSVSTPRRVFKVINRSLNDYSHNPHKHGLVLGALAIFMFFRTDAEEMTCVSGRFTRRAFPWTLCPLQARITLGLWEELWIAHQRLARAARLLVYSHRLPPGSFLNRATPKMFPTGKDATIGQLGSRACSLGARVCRLKNGSDGRLSFIDTFKQTHSGLIKPTQSPATLPPSLKVVSSRSSVTG